MIRSPPHLACAPANPFTERMPNDPRPAPPKHRDWAPRVWEGSDFFAWLRLLGRNRFRVEPPYWYIAAIVSCVSFGQTLLRWSQGSLHGDRIARTPIAQPPIFVLGHWRTGTTLLHELLILDERHTSPTTLQCFEPCNFLLTEGLFKKYGGILLPDKRPMDNMAAGWDRPQEDEFALALLGLPSTYTDFAFPNNAPLHPGSLDLSGLSERELATWKRTFFRFIQSVAYKDPRRLVLKSPPHTARLPALLELFPDAKFVHIVRDPHVLFASTVNLWMSMAKRHGFQTPKRTAALEAKVYREFRIVHERYEATKGLIPAGNLVEVRYEEIVKDLVGGMEGIYAGLGLDGFDGARPKLDEYAKRSSNYETNKYELTAEQKARIAGEWGDIIAALGYG